MNIKISSKTFFTLVVLLLISSVLIYDNFSRVVVSEKSIEIRVTDTSPKGKGGGVIVPASCGSKYAHFNNECAPKPPPSFGVSDGGGGTSGATGGGTGADGTGASSITINEGGAVTMSFACVNSTSSSGLNFSTGGGASGSVSINPLDTATYTVVCSNGGRSSVEVTVLHPVLEITADPIQVRSGRESLITWSATVVDSCNVTGTNGFSATGLSGSQPSNPITLQSIFTLTCENVAGTLSKSVTVYLIPEFREF